MPASARDTASTATGADGALSDLAQAWDELAEADAMWSVLSDPDRKGGRWTTEDFIAAGEQEIAERLADARTRHGRPRAYGRALDFGCGAGRLVHALSSRFDEVVGVDVSQVMIERAEILTAGRANVTLVVNREPSLGRFPDGAFDLVYTNIVLQHVPTPELIEGYVRELVRVTATGGIALIQVPYRIPLAYRFQPLRRGYGALRRLGVPASALILRTPLQPMRMTALSRQRFEQAVRAAGGDVLSIEPDGDSAYRYAIAGPERRV
jgi:SAM-dependent methyltransferase